MKKNLIVKVLFALTCTILVGACSITNAPKLNETQREVPAKESPADRNVKASGLPLTIEEAMMLTSKYPDKFKSAITVLQARSKSKKEVRIFRFEVSLGTESTTVPSSIQYTVLGNGLEYFRHAMPATVNKSELDEAGIDLFGLGTVVYTNSRFKTLFPRADLQPDQVNVLHGELFNASSPFMLVTKMASTEIAIVCLPQEKIKAEKLHAKLTGYASKFYCNSLPGEDRINYWYLEDTSRYVLDENWIDGELAAKFKIVDVIYDDESR